MSRDLWIFFSMNCLPISFVYVSVRLLIFFLLISQSFLHISQMSSWSVRSVANHFSWYVIVLLTWWVVFVLLCFSTWPKFFTFPSQMFQSFMAGPCVFTAIAINPMRGRRVGWVRASGLEPDPEDSTPSTKPRGNLIKGSESNRGWWGTLIGLLHGQNFACLGMNHSPTVYHLWHPGQCPQFPELPFPQSSWGYNSCVNQGWGRKMVHSKGVMRGGW